MRNIFCCLVMFFLVLEGVAEEMKMLMIGNSFSVCVGYNLPKIVKADGKHHLILTSAHIGGCSLETHANYLKKAQADPSIDPYGIIIWDSAEPKKKKEYKGNLLELLKNNRYDIVTIQQASHFSWNPASYQPFANEIIRCIRQYNPQARILIQQTWSYRKDDPRLTPTGWGFDQQGMHERIRAAYHKLAKETSLELIPTGDAIALWRQNHKPAYIPLTAAERAQYRHPDLPPQSDDIVGRDFWSKQKDGTMTLDADRIHLNRKGEYLQSCVWYGFIFKEDPTAVPWKPRDISRGDCQELSAAAKAALTAAGVL